MIPGGFNRATLPRRLPHYSVLEPNWRRQIGGRVAVHQSAIVQPVFPASDVAVNAHADSDRNYCKTQPLLSTTHAIPTFVRDNRYAAQLNEMSQIDVIISWFRPGAEQWKETMQMNPDQCFGTAGLGALGRVAERRVADRVH